MALTPSFTLNYNLDKDSATFGKFIFTDTTSLGGGVGVGYFKITYPSGVVRQGSFATPDIDTSVSLVFNTLSVPQDSNSDFLEGVYTFEYNLQVTGGTDPGTYVTTKTFNFCPAIKFPTDGYADASIGFTADCFCLKINVLDNTAYGTPTTVDRLITLYPPPSLGLSAATSASSSLTYVFSYTGGYEAQVESLVTYVSTIFTVTGRVKSSIYEDVKCDRNLCELYNCYKKFVNNIVSKSSAYGGLTKLPQSDLDNLILAREYAELFDNALKCNQYTDATTYYDKLEALIGCDCGCTSNDTPQLVNPYCGSSGSSGTTTIVQAGTNINVSSTTVGTTTTYTVSLATAFADALSAAQADIATNTANISANTSAIAALEPARYTLLHSDRTSSATSSFSLATLKDGYTLPANTLDVDNDMLKINAQFKFFENGNAFPYIGQLVVHIGSTQILSENIQAVNGLFNGEIDFEFIRYDANSALLYTKLSIPTIPSVIYGPASQAIVVDWSIDNLIKIEGRVTDPYGASYSPSQIAIVKYTVEHFKQP